MRSAANKRRTSSLSSALSSDQAVLDAQLVEMVQNQVNKNNQMVQRYDALQTWRVIGNQQCLMEQVTIQFKTKTSAAQAAIIRLAKGRAERINILFNQSLRIAMQNVLNNTHTQINTVKKNMLKKRVNNEIDEDEEIAKQVMDEKNRAHPQTHAHNENYSSDLVKETDQDKLDEAWSTMEDKEMEDKESEVDQDKIAEECFANIVKSSREVAQEVAVEGLKTLAGGG